MTGTIRSKIIWTFTILVALNLGAGFWSMYNFYNMGTTVGSILSDSYRSVLAAEKMVQSLDRQDNALMAASDGEDPTVGGGFAENKELFFYWHEQAVLSVPPSQRELREAIQTAYREYATYADSMNARIQQGAFAEARHYYFDNVRPTSDRLRKLCFTLFELNQSDLYAGPTRTHAIANKSAYGTLIVSIITLVLSVIATIWLTTVLIRPAEELTEKVKRIGKGRLDLKIDVLSDDEIGQLSREFNKMTERLRQFDQMNIEKIISEKRKSEAIVESISDGLVVTDAEMNIIHINRPVADLFRLDESTAPGQPVTSLIRDERVTGAIREWAGLVGKEASQPTQLLQLERAGKQMFFRLRLHRIPGVGGKPSGVVLVMQDVTQFKELDRMKSDFIATLSHEFRTPLTSINMTVDLLGQNVLGPLNERQRELMESAKQDCERLTKLARELLQLSKLESGRVQFKNEELQIHRVVESSLRPLMLQFQEKKVRLDQAVPEDLPVIIADEQQITWVLTNLVTNALKYTDPGGSVVIRAIAEGRAVVVHVEDTGHGIAKADLGRIFDRFVQIKNASGNTPGSVGLGLAIAKEIVESYGGRIWATSTQGKGSRFSFTLPTSLTLSHHTT